MGKVIYTPNNFTNFATNENGNTLSDEVINVRFLNEQIKKLQSKKHYEIPNDTNDGGWLVSVKDHKENLQKIFPNGTIIASDKEPLIYGTTWYELTYWAEKFKIPFRDGDTIVNRNQLNNFNTFHTAGTLPLHGHKIELTYSNDSNPELGTNKSFQLSKFSPSDLVLKNSAAVNASNHNYPAGLQTKFWISYNSPDSNNNLILKIILIKLAKLRILKRIRESQG